METSLRVPSLHPDTVTERAVEESRADSIDCQHVGSPENHRDASTGNKKCSQVYQKDLISASEEGNNSTVAAPSGVSKAMWEKFRALQTKRESMTKASREKRSREVQQEALSNVKKHFNDQDLEILKKHNVSTDESPSRGRKRLIESDDTHCKAEASNEQDQSGWNSVKKFIDVNQHLSLVEQGKHAPKGKLESTIDAAIARGDYAAAESLSDDLATRDFGKKIADAFDARRYSEQKQKEETLLKERKKRKVAWRFDHKERWETKGNM